MRLLWLADVLRAAGLTVVEVDGWKTRGSDSYGPLRGLVCHETRGSANSTDSGEIRVLVDGRVGLSGPISQLYLSRSGVWHVVASGTCHHVKTGWGGIHAGHGNDSLIGVEAAHAESEDWDHKPAQFISYVTGVAAICRHMGWTSGHVVGHKEHQPGDKPDPEFDMKQFRALVEEELEDDMSVDDVRKGLVQVYDEAANRNTPTGRQFGDDLAKIQAMALGPVMAKIDQLLARPTGTPGPVDVELIRRIVREELDRTSLSGSRDE